MAAPTFIQEAEVAWTFNPNNTASTTTSSFSVQTGDVLVASAILADTAGYTLSISSSNGLTWTLQQTSSAASYCTTYVWTAIADADESMTVTFTRNADLGFNVLAGGNVLTFRGSDGVGASSKTNTTGAPSLGLTTTQDNSAIVVFTGDWNAADGSSRTWRTVNSITPTSGNGLEVSYYRDASFYTIYGAYYSDAGASGSKTVGLSAPSGQQYSIVALEVLGTAGGAVEHPSSGALSAGAATVAGSATHLTLHTTSGALTSQAATVSGSAVSPHLSSGELAAQAATVAGSAAHLTLHTSSGDLSAHSATVAGAAAHEHASAGALSAQAATVAGEAEHAEVGTEHTTSGALSAEEATVAGEAQHLTLHTSSGALEAQPSAVSGSATHLTLHTTSGALVASAATVGAVAVHSGEGSVVPEVVTGGWPIPPRRKKRKPAVGDEPPVELPTEPIEQPAEEEDTAMARALMRATRKATDKRLEALIEEAVRKSRRPVKTDPFRRVRRDDEEIALLLMALH